MTVSADLQRLFAAEADALASHLAISAAMNCAELVVSERSLIDPETPRTLIRFAERRAPALGGSLNLLAAGDALPFARDSIDCLLLPHLYDRKLDHEQTLRQAGEMLTRDGVLVVTGFNPLNLPSRWLARRWRGQCAISGARPRLPQEAMRRLAAAGFVARYQRWLPYSILGSAFVSADGQRRLVEACDRWWPAFAPAYVMVLKYRPRKAVLINSTQRAGSRLGVSPLVEPTRRRNETYSRD